MSARLSRGAHPRAHHPLRPRPALYPTSHDHTHSRPFHTSPPSRLDDHYATLGLAPSSPTSEVKKQFYSLSKAHHPDRNPADPDAAAQKFVAISNAYAILGDPAKREKYDRERGHAHANASTAGPTAAGSYSSASSAFAAGARKASGLSKRRAHFRGPPPSFYRNGGWGAASAKREANIGRDGREAEAQRQRMEAEGEGSGGGRNSAKGGGYAGTTGAWPFRTDPNDVAHFDREGHYRTQSSIEDQLRRGRRKRRGVVERATMDPDDGEKQYIGFLGVCGMLAVGFVSAAFFVK